MKLTRRSFFSVLSILGWFPASFAIAKPEEAELAIAKFTGGKSIQAGRVKLIIPPLVENGNLVVMRVQVESPMTPTNYVSKIHVVAEGNPLPNMVTFYLGPRAGRADVTTRVRIADSQRVWALAEMNDGSFWQGYAETVVTLSACTENI